MSQALIEFSKGEKIVVS